MSQLEPKDEPILINQAKCMKDRGIQVKQETPTRKRGWRSILSSDICVQITAWLLLAVGLCILTSTLYVAVLHTNYDIDDSDDDSGEENGYDNEKNDNHKYPWDTTTMHSESEALVVRQNKSVRTFRLSPAHIIHNKLCQEYNCKVTCSHVDNMKDVLSVVQTSCVNIDVLLIKDQVFPNGLLHNPWIDINRTVYELEISNSNITNIKCSTFNSPPFMYTYQLSLRDLHLTELSGGVLLGLQSLSFLLIDTPLKRIDRAFLQPVQMTLQHLSINSGLVIAHGQTIFGVSKLSKLEYADLSDNIFIGPLTREMFRATPSLRSLHIHNSHIKAVNSDAFDDLADVLQVLDLSGNLLTTISDSTLTPLLMGTNRALLSLSYNKWNCDCDLQGFVDVYRLYRKQFIDSIYCNTPYSYFGEPLDVLSLENDGCVDTTIDIKDYSETSQISDAETTPTTTTATTIKTRFNATTKLRYNVPTTANLLDTTHTSDNITNKSLIDSASAEPITRSTAVDLDIITLRCMSTPMADRSREKQARRRRRAIANTVQSPPPKVTNELGEDCLENQTHPNNVSPSDIAPRKLKNTTNADATEHLQNRTRNSRQTYSASILQYAFEMPTYTFNLTLMSKNAVKVRINDYNKDQPVNMIWFRSQSDMSMEKTKSSSTPYVDYHCENYHPPHLIVNDLYENSTYTFCILSKQETISPFDCQPLFVPLTEYSADGTWISADEKPFTVGMLCLIFALSTTLGGVIGYFGIRQYPELLEGSDKVLVVKSSEAEANYLKSMMGSIGEASLSRQSTRKLSLSHRETPPLSLPPPPPPFSVTTFALERLSSVNSAATCFEKSFDATSLVAPDNQYELPKTFSSLIYEEQCVTNPYGMSPCSPPPLPKRNSSITSAIMANRCSKGE